MSRVVEAQADALAKRLAGVSEEVGELRRERAEVKDAVAQVETRVADIGATLSQKEGDGALHDSVRMLEERVVAWLERLNVRAVKGDEEAREAAEDRREIKKVLGELLSQRAETAQLRTRLQEVRDCLSGGLGEIREEVLRNVLTRTFFGNRMEAALQPSQNALFKLEGILKELSGK